jgi:phenylalanyl-tRNA synthetase beta chain
MVEGGKVIEDITIAFLSEHSKANLAEARTVVNYILGKLGMKADLGEGADSSMIGGRTGIVTVNGIRRGAFGELHPKVLSNFGIEEPVVGGEIVISHDVRR